MGSKDYNDLFKRPKAVADWTPLLASPIGAASQAEEISGRLT
jgi:hypothetical protein